MSRVPQTRREDGIDSRLVPPGVHDERAAGFVAVLARGRDELPPSALNVTDFDTVDARLLPALVRGHSLQEFMFDGIAEELVRLFLKNAAVLHEKKGTVEGVRFALTLLQMRIDWTAWHDDVPAGVPNTYRARIWFGRSIFAGDPDLLPKSTVAARAAINAMKRWSQDGSHEFGVVNFATRFVGALAAEGSRYVAALPGDDPVEHPANLIIACVPLLGGRWIAQLEAAA